MPANVWLMDGAVIPASVGRFANFFATKGETGILLPTDLRCTALPTPGAAIRFAPGTAAIENTYATASRGQSYITNLEASEDLAIPATGSGSGATRRVWQRINDPQYSGSTYNATFGYGSAWPTGFPYVKIATINQPASTATITQVMIVDERVMAVPRERTVTIARPANVGDTGLTLSAKASAGKPFPIGEFFPNFGGDTNNGYHAIAVPTWATQMEITAIWESVRYAQQAGWGEMWVSYGPDAGSPTPTNATQAFAFDADENAAIYRTNWILADTRAVLAAWRGTTIGFVLRATRKNTNAQTGTISLDLRSGVILSVRFLERPDN